METFASNENNHTLYFDYPFYKKVNKDGSLADMENSDALAPAVKMWLASKRNEKVRSLGGGILYPYLGKMMDDDKADEMKGVITQGLQNDFTPPLTPVEVTVVANVEKERWEIGIVAYNADLAIGVNTKAVILNSI